MDEDTKVEETTPSKPQLKHEFGRLLVGSIAAYAADKAASKAYDKVLEVVRARKAR